MPLAERFNLIFIVNRTLTVRTRHGAGVKACRLASMATGDAGKFP
jgi:hypothetical protein